MYPIKVSTKKGDLHLRYGDDKYTMDSKMGSNKHLYPNTGDADTDNKSMPMGERNRILGVFLTEILKKAEDERNKSEKTLLRIIHNN